MNSPIQLLLTFLVSGIGLIGLARLGKPLASRMVILTFMVAGIVAVLNPEITTRIARLLGVGRGADLLIYIGSLSFCYLFLLFHLRMKKLEHQLRLVAREQAIHSANLCPKPERPVTLADDGA